ncbi:AMP-binding protein, partial [Amycolatopsis minnesotensis]|uniref:AMP-binding protein n=1 Tax=Amycolatopsis minnesotensis TaxID=337894 RepID=UPI0031DFBCF5
MLSFAGLEWRSRVVASGLRARGVGAGVLVGLGLGRGVDAVVAMVGVVRAGAGFVPLDPGYPGVMLAGMVADAAPSCVITSPRWADRIPGGVPVLDLAELETTTVDTGVVEVDELPVTGTSAGPGGGGGVVYVMFTSGSTGRAKGVVVDHANVEHIVSVWDTRYGLAGSRARCVSVSGVGVDLFFADFLVSVLFGGQMIIAPDEAVGDPAALAEVIDEHSGSMMVTVPSMATALAEHYHATGTRGLGGLDLLIVGSEGWRTHDATTLTTQTGTQPETQPGAGAGTQPGAGGGGGVRVFNAYGATETTVDATVHQVRDGRDEAGVFVSLGRALGNTRVVVVDRWARPVPAGVPGEVWVGGGGVAQGYWRRPDLTAARFIADPHHVLPAGQRWYRTGDRARWRPDGTLEFLGRADDQVKIRGFRVEPAAIETALTTHPHIATAAVTTHTDPTGHTRLIAYLTPTTDRVEVDVEQVRVHVARSLPAHAVPTGWMVLDRLPLGPTGKINRKALPAPHTHHTPGTAAPRIAPATPTETTLVHIWADVLSLPPGSISVTDNFFTLGGDSILSLRITSRIRTQLGHTINPRQLFDTPTITTLAPTITTTPTATTITPHPTTPTTPLSHAQQRLWFLHQFTPNTTEYNSALVLRMRGELDTGATHRSVADLVARHEQLRTTFDTVDGRGVQIVGSGENIAVTETDLSTIDISVREERLQSRLHEVVSEPFDLRTGPVVRVNLVKLNAREHVLAFVIHHIATDGWSMRLLAKEFGEFYTGHVHGTPVELPPLAVQYTDYAHWQRQQPPTALAEDLAFWKTT